ncbi:MAG TPA: CoA transferase [Dehalococcoidia bacterium]|nr:CoA transferase [Dehalococcoidia bacterium]
MTTGLQPTGPKTTALDGMRVLDMTQYEAGTSATQMLAWLGADIVKVESPAGDPGRKVFTTGSDDSQYFLNYNSNKRSIVLDLKQSRGRDLLLDLVPKFDVFVENFGPGVIEKLDLGYDVLRERNPALIYARIKGYGLSGPYSGWKCFDPLAQAASGAVSVTGSAGGPPVKPGPTFADTSTGMQTALAITAAWAQRLQSGLGQEIELSMQEVMTMFMRTTGVSYWADAIVPRQGHSAGAPSGMYPCAPTDDDPEGTNAYVHMLVATSRMWDQLCVAIAREDLLVDPRFEMARQRSENAEALDAEIRAWTTQHSKQDAMRILCEAGVAASAIFDTMDVFRDPHLAERGFIEKVQHPVEGEITLMRSPIRMSESEVPLEPAPIFGANTEEILSAELGMSVEEIEALNVSGVVHSRPGQAFEASVEK